MWEKLQEGSTIALRLSSHTGKRDIKCEEHEGRVAGRLHHVKVCLQYYCI